MTHATTDVLYFKDEKDEIFLDEDQSPFYPGRPDCPALPSVTSSLDLATSINSGLPAFPQDNKSTLSPRWCSAMPPGFMEASRGSLRVVWCTLSLLRSRSIGWQPASLVTRSAQLDPTASSAGSPAISNGISTCPWMPRSCAWEILAVQSIPCCHVRAPSTFLPGEPAH